MVIMRILVVELSCQTMMEQPSVLEYMLSGARGCLWSCLVVPDIKCHCFPRTQLRWCLSDAESPCACSREPGYVLSQGDEVGLAGRW
jgi:hypothetical protein